MRRLSVLIATVLATAIISATPALAQPAVGAPAAAPVAAAAASPSAAAGGVHQGWFADYNTCIWGIGVPAGVAWIIVTTPQTWAGVNKLRSIPGVAWYVPRVMAACGRFIRS